MRIKEDTYLIVVGLLVGIIFLVAYFIEKSSLSLIIASAFLFVSILLIILKIIERGDE